MSGGRALRAAHGLAREPGLARPALDADRVRLGRRRGAGRDQLVHRRPAGRRARPGARLLGADLSAGSRGAVLGARGGGAGPRRAGRGRRARHALPGDGVRARRARARGSSRSPPSRAATRSTAPSRPRPRAPGRASRTERAAVVDEALLQTLSARVGDTLALGDGTLHDRGHRGPAARRRRHPVGAGPARVRARAPPGRDGPAGLRRAGALRGVREAAGGRRPAPPGRPASPRARGGARHAAHGRATRGATSTAAWGGWDATSASSRWWRCCWAASAWPAPRTCWRSARSRRRPRCAAWARPAAPCSRSTRCRRWRSARSAACWAPRPVSPCSAPLPLLLGDLLPVTAGGGVSWSAALTGLGVGVWTATAFALWPLAAIRRVSPARRPAARGRGRRARAARSAAPRDRGRAGADGGRRSPSCRRATRCRAPLFAAGIVVVLAGLWAAAAALRRGLRATAPARASFAWRQGIASLFRPANQTTSVVLALGFAAFLLDVIVLVQHNLLRDLRDGQRRRPSEPGRLRRPAGPARRGRAPPAGGRRHAAGPGAHRAHAHPVGEGTGGRAQPGRGRGAPGARPGRRLGPAARVPQHLPRRPGPERDDHVGRALARRRVARPRTPGTSRCRCRSRRTSRRS